MGPGAVVVTWNPNTHTGVSQQLAVVGVVGEEA